LAGAVLKEDPQNGEAWFLLGEATEGDRKLLFMKKAQKLDPLNQEYTARIAELTAPPPPPPPAPEPEPELVDSWDDFDMAALADAEDDGEPIDTSAIMVDDAPPAKKKVEPAPTPEPEPTPAPQPAPEPKPVAAATTTTAAKTSTTPPPSQKKEKPAPAEKKGMDWDFIGMVGFGALAVLLLVIAFWLLFFAS
jgi:hypothetical protein